MPDNFWIGSNYGSYNSPWNWTLDHTPTVGDAAWLTGGTAVITTPSYLDGYYLLLGSSSPSSPATLGVYGTNVTFGPSLDLLAMSQGSPVYGTLGIYSANVTNNGLMMATDGATLKVSMAYGGLINNSYIEAAGSNAHLSLASASLPNTTSFIQNNGEIIAWGGTVDIGAPVSGHGAIGVEAGGRLNINAAVASSETVQLTSGMIEFGQQAAMQFQAPVTGLQAGAAFEIDNAWEGHAPTLYLADISPGMQRLIVNEAPGLNAAGIYLSGGSYHLPDFALSQDGHNAVITYGGHTA